MTKYEYNPQSLLTKKTDPLGQAETYAYDAANGTMLSKTDRNGMATSYLYDDIKRPVQSKVGSDVVNVNYTLTGQKGSESNNTSTVNYQYDSLGRMTKESIGDTTKTYGYNLGDAKTSFVLSANNATQLNQSYSYDANGNRASAVYDNGLREDYEYNKANLLTHLINKKDSTLLSQYDYAYYLDGNQASKAESGGKVVSYTYDGLARLKSETEAKSGQLYQSYAYSFDDFGNRSNLTAGGTEQYTVAYQYDRNNRLLNENKAQGATQTVTEFYYDKNGNQKAMSVSTLQDAGTGAESLSLAEGKANVCLYDYNGFNQLTRVTKGADSATYSYLPSGLRNSKTVNSATTNFVLDGDYVALESQNGAVVAKYLWAQNLVSGTVNGSQRYYLYNGHGDVVNLTDSAGSVTKTYDYDAFGNEKSRTQVMRTPSAIVGSTLIRKPVITTCEHATMTPTWDDLGRRIHTGR